MKTNICIRNLLKYILALQNNSCDLFKSINDCSNLSFNPSISLNRYNTRVITLYTRFNQLFESSFDFNGDLRTSNYFRIQDVDDYCCTLLILDNSSQQFLSTGQTIKVNLSCIGAIKCIDDVNIVL